LGEGLKVDSMLFWDEVRIVFEGIYCIDLINFNGALKPNPTTMFPPIGKDLNKQSSLMTREAVELAMGKTNDPNSLKHKEIFNLQKGETIKNK